MVTIGNITIKPSGSEDAKERIKSAEARKKSANETLEEAWVRILAMKNSDKDSERLREVKQAMEDGLIGREPVAEGKKQKRFSKAEALRLHKALLDKQRETILREMVDNMPDNYVLITGIGELYEAIAELKREKLVVFDVETTGVDVYNDIIVGHVLSATSKDVHYYIPTDHDDDTPQLNREFVAEELRVIYENPRIGFIAHNAKKFGVVKPFSQRWNPNVKPRAIPCLH